MPTHIHPTAIVAGDVTLGDNVRIGPFSIVEGDVRIGDDTVIAERVSLVGRVDIGRGNHIGAGCVIGSPPQDIAYAGQRTRVIIGDDNRLREYVTINAASGEDGDATVVGGGCYFMVHSHVGHNCVVGDGVVLTNGVSLGGHVEVGGRAVLGGMASVHQFARVGELAMVSGYSKVIQDAPPFMTVVGQPTRVAGLNSVGLSRAGFSAEDKAVLKKALRLLFRSKLSYKTALARMAAELPPTEPILRLMAFMRSSKRGVSRGCETKKDCDR